MFKVLALGATAFGLMLCLAVIKPLLSQNEEKPKLVVYNMPEGEGWGTFYDIPAVMIRTEGGDLYVVHQHKEGDIRFTLMSEECRSTEKRLGVKNQTVTEIVTFFDSVTCLKESVEVSLNSHWAKAAVWLLLPKEKGMDSWGALTSRFY